MVSVIVSLLEGKEKVVCFFWPQVVKETLASNVGESKQVKQLLSIPTQMISMRWGNMKVGWFHHPQVPGLVASSFLQKAVLQSLIDSFIKI